MTHQTNTAAVPALTRLQRLFALTALCISCLIPHSLYAGEEFQLYLVRHAEKAIGDTPNPSLTPQGRERAKQLAQALADKNIQAIWTSNYRRTKQTVAPLAAHLNLNAEVYNPSQSKAMAERLLSARKSALVAGHSNTIPELASVLCNCEVNELSEDDYDNLFIINLKKWPGVLKVVKQSEYFSQQ